MNRLLTVPMLAAAVALLGACAVAPIPPYPPGGGYPAPAPGTGHGTYDPAYRAPDPYYVNPDPYYSDPDPYYRGYDPEYVYPGHPGVGVGIGITVPPAVVVPGPRVVVRPAPVIVVPGTPRHGARRGDDHRLNDSRDDHRREGRRDHFRGDDRHEGVRGDERRGDIRPPFAFRPRAPEPGVQRPPASPGPRRGPQEAFVPRDERGETTPARNDRARAQGPATSGQATRSVPAPQSRTGQALAGRERGARTAERDGGGGANAGRAEVDRP